MNRVPTIGIAELAETTSLVRESASGFCSQNADLGEVRRASPDYTRQLRAKMVEAGWFGLFVPEQSGGYGGSFQDMAIILEETGAALASAPLCANGVLPVRALVHTGADASLLEAVITGETIVVAAFEGDAVAFRADGSGMTASRSGAGYVLNGTRRFVHGFADQAAILILAGEGQDRALFLVDGRTRGVESRIEPLADGTESVLLSFRDVEVAGQARIAHGETAARAVSRAVLEAQVMVSAELLGVMSRALDITVEFARTRVQFGKPIGSFQALQHRIVDLWVQRELTAATVGSAVAALDTGAAADMVERLAVAAKCRASEAGLRITREAIQLHGAMGFTHEHDIGLYLKRAMVLSAWLGTHHQHRSRYGELLGSRTFNDERQLRGI